MGCWLQLKLLVWKNFTLKRRKPLILLLETFIPLFMFIILVYIRQKQPTAASPPQRFRAIPLPSAGLLPIALEFCIDKKSMEFDENGFPTGNLGRARNLIAKLDNFLKSYDPSKLMLSLDNFDRLPEIHGQILEDLTQFHVYVKKLLGSPVSNLFLDSEALVTALIEKLSMPPESARNLSTVSLSTFQLSNDTLSGLLKFLEEHLFSLVNPNFVMSSLFSKSMITLKLMTHSMFSSPTTLANFLVSDVILKSLCKWHFVNSSSTTTPVELFVISLCRANATALSSMLYFLETNLKFVNALKNGAKIQLPSLNFIQIFHRLANHSYNLWNLVKFMKFLDGVSRILGRLELGACSNAYADEKAAADGKKENILSFWNKIQTFVCGSNATVGVNAKNKELHSVKPVIDMLNENKQSIFVHMFQNDIKILYAPNNTAVDEIIKKANSTLNLLELANKYMDKLGSITLAFRNYVASGAMEENHDKVLELTKDLVGAPSGSPALVILVFAKLVAKSLFPDKELLLDQLDTVQSAVCHWRHLMPKRSMDIFRGFREETEALSYFKDRAYAESVNVFAVVIFRMNGDGSLPKHVTYTIRQNATMTPQTTYIRPRNWAPGPVPFAKMYYTAGFIWIQDVIDRAIISIHAGREVVEPGTYVQQFPEPCFIYDKFFQVIRHAVPLCLIVAWLYTVAMLVQDIVYEKEKRLKEVMKVMGLTNLIHWLSFFLTSFLQFTFTIIGLTACLIFGGIIRYSSFFLLFLFLEVYALATIAFSFLISTLFSKAKLAAACAGILYFLSYLPHIYITIKEDMVFLTEPLWERIIASFFSTTAFALAMRSITFYEIGGTGANFDNWNTSPMEKDDLSLRLLFLILLVDSFIYCALIWYIQIVFPGSYGLSRPWYFPFTKSYWCGSSRRRSSIFREKHECGLIIDNGDDSNQQAVNEGPIYFEPDPVHLPVGVRIHNLVKVFKSGKKLAVDGLSLNFYEGQITSFLGHNGAGKTTTMSILTGLLPATSGTAFIYDLDICKDMDTIRKDLGMCPQHNVLFDVLTVEEHLWFYCRLKGMSSGDALIETEKVLRDIDLVSKRSQRVDCLVGGMTRMLSVAIAFVGGKRTVILDEPTSGVDPCSRRAIWDLILKYKKGRTILLSTHHMDEAEILGDRVAVIANGKLLCCGSPLFLKSQLGTGYHLYLVKKGSEKEVSEINHSGDSEMDLGGQQISSNNFHSSCCEQVVTDFIRQSVPSATFESETPYELHYVLPTAELRRGNFERLFLSLDSQLPALQVRSYGVKSATLEEVFLRVTSPIKELGVTAEELMCGGSTLEGNLVNLGDAGASDETFELHGAYNCQGNGASLKQLFGKKCYQKLPIDDSLEIDFSPLFSQRSQAQELVQGQCLYLLQFFAILQKRFLCTKRNSKGIFSQVILPAIFIAVAMTVALTSPTVDDLPPLTLSASQYRNLTMPKGQFVPFSNHRGDYGQKHRSQDAISGDLEETFHLASGIGSTCVSKPSKDFKDEVSGSHQPKPLVKEKFEPACHPFFVPGISLRYSSHQTLFTKMHLMSSSKTVPKAVAGDVVNATFETSSRYHPSCQCRKSSHGFVCSTDGYEDAPAFRVVSGETLVNVTGDNELDYLLYTSNDNRLHRYGSLTFGVTSVLVPASFGQDAPALIRRIATRNVAKVLYNTNGHHSMPTFLSVLNNAILRANLPINKGIDPSVYGITVINHPLPDTNTLSNQDRLAQGTDVVIAIFVIIAMSFIPASFVLFLVTERSSKAKHLQMVSGVKPFIYWIGNYVWDFCNSVIPAIVCIFILILFHIHAFSSDTNLPAVISLFLIYGWSMTPVMYPVSYLFHEPSTAYVFLIVINLFTGITSLIIDSLLKNLASSNEFMLNAYDIMQVTFLLFPNYCLGQGLVDLSVNDFNNLFLIKTGRADEMVSPWTWHIIPKKLLAMTFSGFLFFSITLLCERRASRKTPSPQGLPVTPPAEDEDVTLERRRVAAGMANDDALRLDNLTKVYRTKKMGDCLAVDRLSLGMRHGECFGLLGTNGCGKSTIFALVTGDTKSTAGDVFINGFSVNSEFASAQNFIGYCPQFDALYDELTGREHLNLYSSFRGIPRGEHKKTVDWAISKMDLVPYADRQAGTYSGGNRRKLATALALIANPKVILLDEPSTGMDPHSKRFLWEAILDLIRNGHSVILSSHSMEECEALCSRVAIMVNGRFCCLGSVQHLKNKFGGGYSVSVWVRGQKFAPVASFFKATFPNSVLKEWHHNTMHFALNSATASLAYIFSCMEEALNNLPIADYSVCQNTLDNVFVNFVQKQPRMSTDCPIERTEPRGNSTVTNGTEKVNPDTTAASKVGSFAANNRQPNLAEHLADGVRST